MIRTGISRIPQITRSAIRHNSTMAAASDVSTYRFNHTQFRIKDPKITLPWYKETLGFEVNYTVPDDPIGVRSRISDADMGTVDQGV
jgi:hypothetical protein